MDVGHWKFFQNLLTFIVVFATFAHEVRADDAPTYCLSAGQLTGLIFGCILGSVALLAGAYFIVNILKRRNLRDTIKKSHENFGGHGSTAELTENRYAVYHNRIQIEDENDPCRQQKKNLGHAECDGYKEKQAVENVKRKSSNLHSPDSQHEYRSGKRKISHAFGAWWTQHSSTLKNTHRRLSRSNESLNSLDEIVRVTLRSKDFNGLGFNMRGNLRDGIFVKSLTNRGPAKECGLINEGDRITGVTINFENITFEDALTIISYASPYPITLELQKADRLLRPGVQEALKPAFDTLRKSVSPNTSALCKTPQFHPLIKSHSIEDVSTLRNDSKQSMPDPNEIFEARRSKSVAQWPNSDQPKPINCTLNLIEETPMAPKRHATSYRNLESDHLSVTSSTSSKINLDPCKPLSCQTSPNTVTVTAEINPLIRNDNHGLTDKCVSPTSADDPYAGLSYEERLQIIRLSYEDAADLSRSTPNLCSPTSDTEHEREGHANHVKIDSDSSPVSACSKPRNSRIPVARSRRVDRSSTEDTPPVSGISSMSSSADSASMANKLRAAKNMDPDKQRKNASGSPSGSSMDVGSGATGDDSSDNVSSPERSKRDSGYGMAANSGANSALSEDEIEKEQYEKLLYFQQQLAKQHEELSRLGIHVPVAVAPPVKTSPQEEEAARNRRALCEQSSA